MNKLNNVEYYMLSETVVDDDIAQKNRKILRENTTTVNGMNLFTVTYEQVLQDFVYRNWNGRIYPKDTVMNAINNNPLIQHDLKCRTWTAEYGHPDIDKGENPMARQMKIEPKFACNTIDRVWVKDDKFLMAECTTLAGGYGEILRDRILTNYPAMASSRAIGGVDKNGNVLPGYTLITFDTVIRPSHKLAYQVGDAKINDFSHKLAMSESARMMDNSVKINPMESEDFKNFLMTESASREKIQVVCETLGFDYLSMRVVGKNLHIGRLCESGTETVVMPISKLVNMSYYNLF